MATEKQLVWVGKCLQERIVPDHLQVEAQAVLANPSRHIGSLLTHLFKCPRKATSGGDTPPWVILQADWPAIVPGYYAVNAPGHPLHFFKVTFGEKVDKSYAGRIFVKRVVGGQPNQRVTPDVARNFLQLASGDVAGARKRFADELERCSECGTHLTDPPSRAAGYGKHCANKLGIPWGAVPGTSLAMA